VCGVRYEACDATYNPPFEELDPHLLEAWGGLKKNKGESE